MTGEALAFPGHLSPTGLELPEGLSEEEWIGIGGKLLSLERSVMWWIGDWWAYGEHRYGARTRLAAEGAFGGYSFQTLRDAGWVARSFETSRRRDVVSWSHHREVSSLPVEEQEQALDAAEAGGWSQKDLRAAVKQQKNAIGAIPSPTTCTSEDLHEMVRRGEKFGTVYADPPWLYGNQATRAATGNHYGGMTVEEIAALPVSQLVADDAHLHLWTTNAFLFDCRAIMEAWGFTYKSCFVWVKPQMGIGNYWRVSHEFLLFGIRGSAPFRDRGQKSWLECARGKHSAKPEQVRAIIEKASPGAYLELFGRAASQGWTVWGNQIERNLFFPEAA